MLAWCRRAPMAAHEPAVEVRDVFMAPDPPVIGHPFELQLPAVARQMIAGGEVAVTIKFHGLPVHVEYTDICQQTACPVLPGSFTFQYWRNVPSLAFPGPYYACLMATDRNSTELFCIIVTLKVVRGVAGNRVGDKLGSLANVGRR
ncbi:unnamed protein product [Closterium sp. Naga37s-1]|nr:unnamed protein product [Closterium sp. Naga37s-1]